MHIILHGMFGAREGYESRPQFSKFLLFVLFLVSLMFYSHMQTEFPFNSIARLASVCIGYLVRSFFSRRFCNKVAGLPSTWNSPPTPAPPHTHTHTRPTQSHTHTQTFTAAFLFDQLLICTKPQTSRATAELPRFLFVMCVSLTMRIGYVVCSCVCVCLCRCEHVSVLVLLLFVFFVERL